VSAIIPSQIFLTKGTGRHKEKLASFELALRYAGIAPFNLVKISSILPPKCIIISKEKGIKLLSPGQILFLVISENATNEAHRSISASIGVAIPDRIDQYGYLSEHHDFGREDFDLREIWEKEKSTYKISEDITVKTKNITQTASGKDGIWTTVISAAVCIT